MAVSFNVPASPQRSIITIEEFLGVDFSNNPTNIDASKSPNCQNMIRDVPGKVRKCMGYRNIATYDGQINGAHFLYGDEEFLIHAGTNIYKGKDILYSGAANERSKSWQVGENLYIIDGKCLLKYDGKTIKKASDGSKIPVLTISRNPSGGGVQYEALNLLNSGFSEWFLGTETEKSYHLSFGDLDSTAVKVEKMNANGSWTTLKEGTDFTVDRTSGIILFTTAPGKSPLEGEDNVKITAYRTVDGYADRINKCTVGTLFGVNGATDRLFLSGNPDFINSDWYSGQNDPTYFPDTGYSMLGSAKSAVIGYTIINDRLAVHKDAMEEDRNVILREGNLVNNEPSFRITNTLQGPGAVGKYTFGYLATEPLFLTNLGVYAITAQDVTGEKYAQNRSFYLNGKLLEETNQEDAYACVYKDLYWLCLNGVAYILDGLQPVHTDKSLPYATRQYVGYYRTNLPARIMWVHNNELYFGTKNGKICKFYSNPESSESYNDNGVPIHAIWETPEFEGNLFYKNKTFRFMAVRLASALSTSVRIYALKRGIWGLVKEDSATTRYLSFSGLVFSKLTFSSDATPKIVSSKVKVKKVDRARFRLENNQLNELFGINDLAFEFVEGGNYKG